MKQSVNIIGKSILKMYRVLNVKGATQYGSWRSPTLGRSDSTYLALIQLPLKDRKSVGQGKSVKISVDGGGRR